MAKDYDTINICFLDAGPTKNVYDGSFGCVKCLFRSKNVHDPVSMMDIIEKSSRTTTCIPASQLECQKWRELLPKYFIMPGNVRAKKPMSFLFEWRACIILLLRNFQTLLRKRVLTYMLTCLRRVKLC